MNNCYICGNDITISEDFIIEDGISLEICLSCAGKCESCANKGYLEVTHDDSCEYIEACGECDYFGILGTQDELNTKARDKAYLDGIFTDNTGKILDNSQ